MVSVIILLTFHTDDVLDEFPGPTIQARSGDILVIEVTNSLSNDEELSIHWHGMHMKGTVLLHR